MRCQSKGPLVLVLFLTSLFFLSACGIPRIINLDEDITLSRIDTSGVNSVVAEITVSDGSAAKLSELFTSADEGPSLKLFYVLSSLDSGPVTNQEINQASYNLNTVPSRFTSVYYPSRGNGIQWSPKDSSQAPALYIYTDSNESPGKASHLRPDTGDMSETEEGILVGTFARSATVSAGTDGYFFGTQPDMDLLIESGHYTKTLQITIEPESFTPTNDSYPVNGKDSTLMKMTVEVVEDASVVDTVFLADYRKFPFPHTETTTANGWTVDDFKQQYLDNEDAYFYHNLYTDYSTSQTTLYLHIYGAIYAGEGNFTNIYWSSLEYLGYIEL